MLLIYSIYFLTEKGYVGLKHQLYTLPPNPRHASVHLGLVLLVISIINNLCAIMTQYLHYQLNNWHVLKRTLCL